MTATTTRLAQVREPRISEKRFMGQVIAFARLNGWLSYHPFDSRRSAPGFPDLVLVRPPRVLFVECKTDRGRLRPEQAGWLAMLTGCSEVKVGVWRPKDWPSVERILRGEDATEIAVEGAE